MHPFLSITPEALQHTNRSLLLAVGPTSLTGEGGLWERWSTEHLICVMLQVVGEVLHEAFLFIQVFSLTEFHSVFLRQQMNFVYQFIYGKLAWAIRGIWSHAETWQFQALTCRLPMSLQSQGYQDNRAHSVQQNEGDVIISWALTKLCKWSPNKEHSNYPQLKKGNVTQILISNIFQTLLRKLASSHHPSWRDLSEVLQHQLLEGS